MPSAPEIIDNDVSLILADLVAYYENETGKTLQPAHVEQLLFNSVAYQLSIHREKIQYAIEQCLVKYANAPMLDYLGDLVGVTRLGASRATVNMAFQLVNGHPGVTIPQGTRVSTSDGLVVFQTRADEFVPAGITIATVEAECTVEGVSGNNLAPGAIAQILDPQPYVSAAGNMTQSGGGAEIESDEALRERIILAPASFSNAGSEDAYKYWARTASPSIADVEVIGPPTFTDGEVHIFPLMADGSVTPTTILNAVNAACSPQKVRPLTDLVVVTAPTRVDYEVVANIIIFSTADTVTTPQLVHQELDALTLEKRRTLGQDITISRLTQVSMIAGVYDVDFEDGLGNPLTNITIGPTEYAYCTGITVNITGITNG